MPKNGSGLNANAIAKRRCSYLLDRARLAIDLDPKLSRRYVSLARRIASRHRFSLGQKSFCKKCNSLYVAGVTVKVRLSPKDRCVIYQCLNCNGVKRFGYAKQSPRRKKKTK